MLTGHRGQGFQRLEVSGLCSLMSKRLAAAAMAAHNSRKKKQAQPLQAGSSGVKRLKLKLPAKVSKAGGRNIRKIKSRKSGGRNGYIR